MKKTTLDRIFSTYSLFDYSKNCLNLLTSGDWLLCIPKHNEISNFRSEELFSINNELNIDYFMFNKKIFKKTIWLCSTLSYNSDEMDMIKSSQLSKKMHGYVEKWKKKLEKTLNNEWKKIKKTPKIIQTEYKAECMTASDFKMLHTIQMKYKKNANIKPTSTTNSQHEAKINDTQSDDVVMEKTFVQEKILRLKNRNKCVNVGSIWKIDESTPSSLDPDLSHFLKTDPNSEIVTESSCDEVSKHSNNEELASKTDKQVDNILTQSHCDCCKYKVLKEVKEIQTDPVEGLVDHYQQTDAIKSIDAQTQHDSQDLITFNKGVQTECRDDKLVDIELNRNNTKVEKKFKTNFDHILSSSLFLGEPKTKRSRDLMTSYDELNSVLGKLKKVCGRRVLTTPDTTYLSYRLFEQFELEKQLDLIVQYRAISSLYKQLRTEFIESKSETEFSERSLKILKHIQQRIFYLNSNINILVKQNDENSDDQITTVVEFEDEQVQHKAEVKGLIGDYSLESTPQEGNSQQIMTLDDDIINSLML
jgi:hypothetical protein